jgi:SNF2 family DNA or RNA helicase
VGHGVSLIGANHVIHVGRWWDAAIEDQAADRPLKWTREELLELPS